MGTGLRTSRDAARLLGGFLLWLLASRVIACPFSLTDPLLQLRSAADITIVKVHTLGPSPCTTVATGFFVSPTGHILTAGHVVPPECSNDNTSIMVQWSEEPSSKKLLGPFPAKVVGRSSLDVLLLQLTSNPDETRQFLQLSAKSVAPVTFKNACVLLPSHYYDQTDTYSTFAEIASVSLEGDMRWALSGDGFNPSRSGSPIIVGDGQVVAIFLGRPGDPTDRERIIASRAYVLPLASIPTHEIDVERLQTAPGQLKKFLTPNGVAAVKAQRVRTSFGISLTLPGNSASPPFFFVTKNGDLSRAPDGLVQAGVQALQRGLSIVRQVAVERSFTAEPGYAFDHKSIEYHIASINPQNATLPKELCDEKRQEDCVVISPDQTTMKLRFFLYPGIDGRRSWVDAEMHVTQVVQ